MTENVQPIMIRKFFFKKTSLNHLAILAGLDRGCSLTKIIYVDQADSDAVKIESNNDRIPLTVALFPNSQFEDALIWLNEKAYIPENKEYPFHVTGAGGDKYSEKIKEILKREVLFIDEFLSQSLGAYHLVTNVQLEEMIFSDIKPNFTEAFNAPFISNIKHHFEQLVEKPKEIKCSEDLLPCIFGFMGSGGGFTYIGRNGEYRMAGGLNAAGKTFIGLCKCILGTNDYNEIAEMAARGDRRNIDTQIKDVLLEQKEYELAPSDFPVIYFGKLAKTKKNIDEFNKDDIARALVSMFMYNALISAIYVCMSENISTIFFGGHLFMAEIFHKEYSELKQMFGLDFIKIYFVNNGHTGALGAMMSSPSDLNKYFKDFSV